MCARDGAGGSAEHVKDDGGELHRAAALREEDAVRRGHVELRADEGLHVRQECLELLRAVRDLGDPYANALEVE